MLADSVYKDEDVGRYVACKRVGEGRQMQDSLLAMVWTKEAKIKDR